MLHAAEYVLMEMFGDINVPTSGQAATKLNVATPTKTSSKHHREGSEPFSLGSLNLISPSCMNCCSPASPPANPPTTPPAAANIMSADHSTCAAVKSDPSNMPKTSGFKLKASSRNRSLGMDSLQVTRSVMHNHVTAHSSDKDPLYIYRPIQHAACPDVGVACTRTPLYSVLGRHSLKGPMFSLPGYFAGSS